MLLDLPFYILRDQGKYFNSPVSQGVMTMCFKLTQQQVRGFLLLKPKKLKVVSKLRKNKNKKRNNCVIGYFLCKIDFYKVRTLNS